MAKHKVLTHAEVSDQWNRLFKAINHEEDLVTVVVATSYIDFTLAALLKAHFIDSSQVEALLNPSGGALGGLLAKANVAYCLGLLSKDDRGNIERIANIRNTFAHKIGEISFASPDIEKWCESLTSTMLSVTSPTFAGKEEIKDGGKKSPLRSRSRFRFVAVQLCSQINVYAQEASKCTPRSAGPLFSTAAGALKTTGTKPQIE